ncbi:MULTISPECIES: endonuclease/exonuclease/phosphatase family protein [unclassified Enterococcus]|uniref:endonuclease/exonuclease/phosphatase family protein n=1 Tax=unclassified Enterococcus TaxID=2608891 RepID=UPI001552F175|nr:MULTISPECIES: endonuclease/exonuclease/phosphatase family protein [unclassified Enterococcus]MBS7577823.1 endonuclease/exonuclease/phosphatase family protein [Enterococcus sp. MMGLQ5-2]MBS7585083.1 endonuclease/exonuclease/phosphatase family protein [Enterococcus sp. MMGLQ5-1]NPD12939.1 endonuclease/exonuclease/phosphatase family protein [Enterococcus sp. MMGLQ5-1]NPD37653.1 endonuclease/exonuclease/phosphatase family protein [Enterococcus sp. MMGLQ5-2]
MKILTLNTHSWLEINQIAKLYQLAKEIIASNIEIIALQEVNQLIEAPIITNQSNIQSLSKIPIRSDNFAYLLINILEQLGSDYYGIWVDSHTGFEIYEEGVALISKKPFVDTQVITCRNQLDFTNVRRRSQIGGAIYYHEEKIWFYSVHFSWWQFENEELFTSEWLNFQKYGHISKNDNSIIMGDFNNDASILDEGYSLIHKHSSLYDSFHQAQTKYGEHTISKKIDGWENNNKELRIDYIFTTQPLKIKTYKILFNGQVQNTISDHYGVSIDLEV